MIDDRNGWRKRESWKLVLSSRLDDANEETTVILFCLSILQLHVKVKLATIVEGNQKAPFSIAITQKVKGRALLLSLDCSTLPLICTLYCWVLSKEVSSTIFIVFGMMQTGIETRSPRPLANTLRTCSIIHIFYKLKSYLKLLFHFNSNNGILFQFTHVFLSFFAFFWFYWHINYCGLLNPKAVLVCCSAAP